MGKGGTHPAALRRVSLLWSISSSAPLDKGAGNETISSRTRPQNQLVSIWFSKTWNLFTKPGRAPSWDVRSPFLSALVTIAFPLQVSCFFRTRSSLAPQRKWAEQFPHLVFFKILFKNEGKTLELDFHTGTAFTKCWQLQLLWIRDTSPIFNFVPLKDYTKTIVCFTEIVATLCS